MLLICCLVLYDKRNVKLARQDFWFYETTILRVAFVLTVPKFVLEFYRFLQYLIRILCEDSNTNFVTLHTYLRKVQKVRKPKNFRMICFNFLWFLSIPNITLTFMET